MSQKMVVSIFLIFLLGSHYLLHPKYYFKISQKGYQFPCKEDIRNNWYISLSLFHWQVENVLLLRKLMKFKLNYINVKK